MNDKVLVVKLGAIGDVIMALPIVEALRSAHPGATIDWVVGPVAAPVLECLDMKDLRIIRANEHGLYRGGILQRLGSLVSLWKVIGLRSYDRIYILNADRRYGAIPLWSLGKRVWLDEQASGRSTIPGRHASSEYVRMATGIDARSSLPSFPSLKLPGLPDGIGEQVRRMSPGLVALSPGGAKNMMREEGLRRWPAEHYLELIQALRSAGHRMMLVGGPGEEWVSERFGSLVDIDLVGRLSLPQTMAALTHASVLVTHDSGPLHMGDVVGVPTIALFGPTMPSEKAPIRSRSIVLWGGERLACRPCYDGRCYAKCESNACLAEIAPRSVFAAIESVLRDRLE